VGTSCGAGLVCNGNNGAGSCVADCYVGGTLYTSGQLGAWNWRYKWPRM